MNVARRVPWSRPLTTNVRIATSLAAGVLDVGFASLAGFCASFYAAHYFEVGQLGLFSVFFVLFQLLGFVPARLILAPAQVLALDAPVGARTASIRATLPPALVAGLLTAPLVTIAFVLTPGHPRADYVAFGLTTATMVILSPLQDNARAILHMARRSQSAVIVSVIQLLVALTAVLSLHWSPIEVRWVPFLALSIANACSLGVAFLLVRARPADEGYDPPALGQLLAGGRLLLPAQILRPLALLGTSVLVARLASAEALGEAEASRVVVAPVAVIGLGIAQVMAPRIMEAARARDLPRFLRFTRGYVSAIFGGVSLFLLVFGWPHPLNVFELLLPLAFLSTGLVALRAASAAGGMSGGVAELAMMALQDNRGLLRTAALGVLIQLAVAALVASSGGAYTVPLAELTGAVAIVVLRIPRLTRGLRTPAGAGARL